jgi:trehalose/maltose hydrolase-like predicted phosphorylase
MTFWCSSKIRRQRLKFFSLISVSNIKIFNQRIRNFQISFDLFSSIATHEVDNQSMQSTIEISISIISSTWQYRMIHVKQNTQENFDSASMISFQDFCLSISSLLSKSVLILMCFAIIWRRVKKMNNWKIKKKFVASIEDRRWTEIYEKASNEWIFRWTERWIVNYLLNIEFFFFCNACENNIWLIEDLDFDVSHNDDVIMTFYDLMMTFWNV